jgi:hypothetical protein
MALHCQDIIDRKKQEKSLLSDYDWPYDCILQDEDGVPVKVINTEDGDIPIEHILENAREDFAKIYPTPKYLEAYDLYMESVEVLDGKEYAKQYRDYIKARKRELDEFSSLVEIF